MYVFVAVNLLGNPEVESHVTTQTLDFNLLKISYTGERLIQDPCCYKVHNLKGGRWTVN